MSKDFLTERQALFLNSSLSSLHSFAASTLAGDSVLGSAIIDITDNRIQNIWTQTIGSRIYRHHIQQDLECIDIIDNRIQNIQTSQTIGSRIYRHHRQQDLEYIDIKDNRIQNKQTSQTIGSRIYGHRTIGSKIYGHRQQHLECIDINNRIQNIQKSQTKGSRIYRHQKQQDLEY